MSVKIIVGGAHIKTRSDLLRGGPRITVTTNGPGRKLIAPRLGRTVEPASIKRQLRLVPVEAVGMPGGPSGRDDDLDREILASITPERARELERWMDGLRARARA